jgi:hypothetical protein
MPIFASPRSSFDSLPVRILALLSAIRAGLTQRAWQEIAASWHVTKHQDPSLGFGKLSACYWKNAVVARTLKGGKGLHTLGIQLSYGHTTNSPSQTANHGFWKLSILCFASIVRRRSALDVAIGIDGPLPRQPGRFV